MRTSRYKITLSDLSRGSRLCILRCFLFWIGCIVASDIQGGQSLLDFIQPSLNLRQEDSGICNIDQIYVLNLDIRYGRWLRTQQQLEAFGAHPQRVSAINGWQLERKKLKKIYRECVAQGSRDFLTRGQVGCFLTHLSILYDAWLQDYNCIWVLEDDVLVLKDIQELSPLIYQLDRFDPEWDVLFTDRNARGMGLGDVVTFEKILGPRFDYSSIQDPHFIYRENEEFLRIQYRLCTHSMLISRRGIKKLLDYFQSIRIAFPIDIQMHCCPGKHFYVSKKEYVTNGIRETSDTTYQPRL